MGGGGNIKKKKKKLFPRKTRFPAIKNGEKKFFWIIFQMADVGTVTGPDYGANQVRIVVCHNFEAARHLQRVSWLTERCTGYLLPPSLWVRISLIILVGT